MDRAMNSVSTDRPASAVDPKLLEILVCPLTKGALEYDAEKQELISRSAKLAYPIRDGIPIMLPEEARRLDCPSCGIGRDARTADNSPRHTFSVDSRNENLPEKRIHQSCAKQPGRDTPLRAVLLPGRHHRRTRVKRNLRVWELLTRRYFIVLDCSEQ